LALVAAVVVPAASDTTQAEPAPQALAEFPPLPDLPPVDSLLGLQPTLPAGRETYMPRVRAAAEKLGLPAALADAVALVESGYDPNARGADGEVGLMQVLPSTAAMLGHTGGLAALLQPEVNIHYGVTYLAKAWQLADGDLCRALMKYRAGHGEERMTPLSVRYCARARAHLASIGSPLAAGAGVVGEKLLAALAALEAKRSALRTARGKGRANTRLMAQRRRLWVVHERRIRAIDAKLSASQLKIMGGS
jgi:soluble lytic murein transglycosylase-like protein